MNRRLPILACIVLLSTLSAASAAAFKRTALGEDLKEFRLEAVAGEPLSLPAGSGAKATLVVFWATWNPRSTQLLGDLQPLYAEHAADGLQIVAVNAEHAEWEPATQELVAELVATQGLTYPVVFDRDLAVYNDYGVVALPSVVLADAAGKIVLLQEGYPTAARLELHDQTLVALGLREPPPAAEVAVPKEQLVNPKVRRRVEMARLLLKRRRPSRAVKVLEEAIATDPTYAEAYRVYAAVLEALQRGDEAAAARAKVTELEQPLETAVAVPASAPAGLAPVTPPPALPPEPPNGDAPPLTPATTPSAQ